VADDDRTTMAGRVERRLDARLDELAQRITALETKDEFRVDQIRRLFDFHNAKPAPGPDDETVPRRRVTPGQAAGGTVAGGAGIGAIVYLPEILEFLKVLLGRGGSP
jgi:hypothetical protein